MPDEAMDPWKTPWEARGRWVTLLPLAPSHEPALIEAVRDGESWRLWYARVPPPEEMGREIQRRLALAREGRMMPFTVLDRKGDVVGMTCYQLLDPANRRVEIGYTWYAARVQKTPLNTEAKQLLLTHAFETLDCIAVGFTTSSFNEPSRRAIERLGAKLDGILRNHAILPGGVVRDTCYYSILDNEWPAVKRHLSWKLEGYARLEAKEPTA
jgi:RimJ/RimL family protein N-acetyltransferase